MLGRWGRATARTVTRRWVGGACAAVLTAGLLVGAPATAQAQAPQKHTISFDQYSLMLDGRRTFIWSGEFHAFRLPSPGLWRDILQKMKASGYNAVSLYFNWAYHSPKMGVYDFTGIRDMDLLLDIAEEVGLYVIARPGPYINAEVDAGGYPGWLTTQAGKARTAAPDYIAASEEWLGHINRIIREHQYTEGKGSVILYQIENELANTAPTQQQYMQRLRDKVRADGITVPLFHNDKSRAGRWVPKGAGVPGTLEGPTDLYAFDGYPGGSCSSNGSVGRPGEAVDWGIHGIGGATGGSTASPNTPGFTAEFAGGWFDYWGSLGTYPCTAIRRGPGYERVFYGTNIANRLSIQNFYMTFGGTNWGWLPAPVVYTSYDYGAAISESRQLRDKALTMKQLGYFLQSVTPITKVDKGADVATSNPKVKIQHNVNNDTGTHFYFTVHNPTNGTGNDAFTFPVATTDGTYTVPQAGTLRLNGQDAKTLVAGYDVVGQRLVYSTSEIMTSMQHTHRGLLLLYGRNGEDGETVLRYSSPPKVEVLSGTVASTFDAATGDLRLNYQHSGLARLRITGGGRAPLTLLLSDQSTADTFWRQDTPAGPILERGPQLVRNARPTGNTLNLFGDTTAPSELEIWAPPKLHTINWNGSSSPAVPSGADSLVTKKPLPGPKPVTLPDLSKSTWRYSAESPESGPGFDDTHWTHATKTTTNSITRPLPGQPVLTADDYGYHHGDVWYRGRFRGDAPASATFRYGGGGSGLLQAWLDGRYLGQHIVGDRDASPGTVDTVTLAIPEAARTGGDHVLSVMVRNNGHNQNGGVGDTHKEGRGLINTSFADAAGAPVDPRPHWRIQGNVGGEDIADRVRGTMNNGGLYGERNGWHLPKFPDNTWQARGVPDTTAVPGTSWYRTEFDVRVPNGDESSIGLTIGDPAVLRSGGAYRVLIFVNGWNMGQYIANVGPQHTFVLPNGILNPNGRNTLALAVTSDGGAGDALESVKLTSLASVHGGLKVGPLAAPVYR